MTDTAELKPVEEMGVDELRAELKERGFPTSGTKADRQVRLQAARETQSKEEPDGSEGAETVDGEIVKEEDVEPTPEEAEREHDDEQGQAAQLADAESKALELRASAPPPTSVVPASGEFNAILKVAAQLAASRIVPTAFQGKPDDIVAAILMGRELGIGPMQSLKDIAVIDGRPALSAHLQLALLRKSGVQILESHVDDDRAYIRARRADTGEVAEVEWTYEEAAKITRKGKRLVDGDNWRNYRRDMLWARCVGRLTRRLGSDLVAGMPYTAEEVADFDDGDGYGGGAYEKPVHRQNEAAKDPGAPKTRAELLERFAMIFGNPKDEYCRDTAAEFIKEALQIEYDADRFADLPVAKANEAGIKIASAVMHLEDTSPDLSMATDVRETVTKAFAAKLPSGPALHGPPWRLGPDEAGLPTYWQVTGKEPPAPPQAPAGAPGAGPGAASPQEGSEEGPGADTAGAAPAPGDAAPPLGPEEDIDFPEATS